MRVLHEVLQHALQRPPVDRRARSARSRLGAHDDGLAGEQVGAVGDGGGQPVVDGDVTALRRRAAGEGAEVAGDAIERVGLLQHGARQPFGDEVGARVGVGAGALQQLRRHAHRLQRVLDLVRDLPRHLGPRLIALGGGEALAAGVEFAGHLVERARQQAEFLAAARSDRDVEVAAGDAARRRDQRLHRRGDRARGQQRPRDDDGDQRGDGGEQHAFVGVGGGEQLGRRRGDDDDLTAGGRAGARREAGAPFAALGVGVGGVPHRGGGGGLRAQRRGRQRQAVVRAVGVGAHEPIGADERDLGAGHAGAVGDGALGVVEHALHLRPAHQRVQHSGRPVAARHVEREADVVAARIHRAEVEAAVQQLRTPPRPEAQAALALRALEPRRVGDARRDQRRAPLLLRGIEALAEAPRHHRAVRIDQQQQVEEVVEQVGHQQHLLVERGDLLRPRRRRRVEHAPRHLADDGAGLRRAFEVRLDAVGVVGGELRQVDARDLFVDLRAHAAQREPAVREQWHHGGRQQRGEEPAGQRRRAHRRDHATPPGAAARRRQSGRRRLGRRRAIGRSGAVARRRTGRHAAPRRSRPTARRAT